MPGTAESSRGPSYILRFFVAAVVVVSVSAVGGLGLVYAKASSGKNRAPEDLFSVTPPATPLAAPAGAKVSTPPVKAEVPKQSLPVKTGAAQKPTPVKVAPVKPPVAGKTKPVNPAKVTGVEPVESPVTGKVESTKLPVAVEIQPARPLSTAKVEPPTLTETALDELLAPPMPDDSEDAPLPE